MSNYSKIYWLTRLDNINVLFIWVAVVAGITLAAFYIIRAANLSSALSYVTNEDRRTQIRNQQKETFKPYNYISKVSWFLFIFAILVSTFLPTRNEAIAIAAGGKALNYVQSDTSLNKIPYQTTKIISDYLEKTIEKVNK